jgi:thiamine pyrophosphokinase
MTSEYDRPKQPKSETNGSGGIAWVLTSGPVDRPEVATQGLVRPDILIAADGGSTLAMKLGLIPDLIVGDMDSSNAELIAAFEAQGVELRRYDHRTKAETDTELALFAALEWQPEEIVLLGALGGRLDHALANIFLLTNPRLSLTRVRIVGNHEQLFVAHARVWTAIHGEVGDTVSLLPVGGSAKGVTLEGFEYLLHGETLPQGLARGVSNRLTELEGRVWVEDGMLLVVQTLNRGVAGDPD